MDHEFTLASAPENLGHMLEWVLEYPLPLGIGWFNLGHMDDAIRASDLGFIQGCHQFHDLVVTEHIVGILLG